MTPNSLLVGFKLMCIFENIGTFWPRNSSTRNLFYKYTDNENSSIYVQDVYCNMICNSKTLENNLNAQEQRTGWVKL